MAWFSTHSELLISVLLGVPFDAFERVVEAVASESQRNAMAILSQLRAHWTSLVEGQQLFPLRMQLSSLARIVIYSKVHCGPHVAPSDGTDVHLHRVGHEIGIDDVPEYLKRTLIGENQVHVGSCVVAEEGRVKRKRQNFHT